MTVPFEQMGAEDIDFVFLGLEIVKDADGWELLRPCSKSGDDWELVRLGWYVGGWQHTG